MKKIILSLILVTILVGALSSCSVVMAAKKEGTSIDQVQKCSSRGQFIAAGGRVMTTERQNDGSLVEIYQFKKERGSAARALMHGAMDFMTLGAWEIIGTPIEACTNDTGYFSIRAHFNENGQLMSAQFQ